MNRQLGISEIQVRTRFWQDGPAPRPAGPAMDFFLAFKNLLKFSVPRGFELAALVGLKGGVSSVKSPPVEVQRSGTGTVKRFQASVASDFLGDRCFRCWKEE
jgi:hypothetical protein